MAVDLAFDFIVALELTHLRREDLVFDSVDFAHDCNFTRITIIPNSGYHPDDLLAASIIQSNDCGLSVDGI